MKIEKKEGSGIDGMWAKVGQDIRDGDRLKILTSGMVDTSGNYGPKKVFKVLTIKKDEFNVSFNQTSLNNLVDGFGEESEAWIGKVVKAFVVRQMVGDGLKNVLYLAPEGWTMDEEGHFLNPNTAQQGTGYPRTEINPDDVPF